MLDWIKDVIELIFPHVAILAMPIILGVLMLVTVGLFILRKWKYGIAVLILALITNSLTETFAVNIPWNSVKPDLTVMTYNMLSSSEYMDEHKDAPETLRKLIMEQNADVVCLQEYDSMRCQHLKEELDVSYPYFALMPKRSKESAVFSKLPLKDVKQDEEVLVTEVTIETKSKEVELFVCHLSSNSYEGIRKEMGDSMRWIDGVGRYFAGIKAAGEQRTEEARKVKTMVDSCAIKGVPVIVCGDMNDVGGSKPLRVLKEDDMLMDAWWEKGFGFGTTYHGHKFMRFRLDHILHTNELECSSVKVVKQDLSDHDPIVTEFKWN